MKTVRILMIELVKVVLIIVASLKAFANFQDSLSNYPEIPLNRHCQDTNSTLDQELCAYGRSS